MPSYFNKKTAEKIASHNGLTMYRLRSGRYVLYNDETDTKTNVDYVYFREWVNRLPAYKLKKVLKSESGIINMNFRISAELKSKIWSLAELHGKSIQGYITDLLVEHVKNEPDTKYPVIRGKKRSEDNQ